VFPGSRRGSSMRAMCWLGVDPGRRQAQRPSRRVVFSGDIGRKNLPILRDPVVPEHADYVLMESTYGNRLHAPADGMRKQLLDAINTARARGGKIIVPSFALERTQEIVFALNDLIQHNELKPIPCTSTRPCP